MTTAFVDPAMSAAVWIIIKASVLLGITAVALASLRQRASAEVRHLVWALAIVGLLLIPILSAVLPDWPVVVRTLPTKTVHLPLVTNVAQEPAGSVRPSTSVGTGGYAEAIAQPAVRISAMALVATVYAAGVLVMLILLGMQWRGVRRLAREASLLQDEAWTSLLSECAASMGVRRAVRLVRSRERSMPMAWGTWRPAILIPAIAETWPADRRRAVILHELAHVARYDCLTQALAFASRVVRVCAPASRAA